MGCSWPKFCGRRDQNHDMLQYSSRNVHHITNMHCWEAKLSQARQDGQIIVANFTTSWSSPCKEIVPIYSELADKYTNLVFLTVDADGLVELSNSWDVKATPTFYFLKDGRQVDKLVGNNKSELEKKTAAMAML